MPHNREIIMSGFCVFGVSREQCRKAAEESTPTTENKTTIPVDEWRRRVVEKARELFEGGASRSKQISPAFDAPQFAEEWVRIGLSSGAITNPVIMTRGTKLDKKGAVRMNKRGMEIISWIPYQPNSKKAA
jgi:hypothetical protein